MSSRVVIVYPSIWKLCINYKRSFYSTLLRLTHMHSSTAGGLVYTHRYMYNGVDKSGSVDWYGLSNIHLLKAETSITLHVNCVASVHCYVHLFSLSATGNR